MLGKLGYKIKNWKEFDVLLDAGYILNTRGKRKTSSIWKGAGSRNRTPLFLRGQDENRQKRQGDAAGDGENWKIRQNDRFRADDGALHSEIGQDLLYRLFQNGNFVCQMRTRLGVGGCERKGPEEAAAELLKLIQKW